MHRPGSPRPALHYVGFRGDEYARARRVFGPPDFVHIGWDRWARLEIVEGDTAIFARGTFEDEVSAHGFPDIVEPWPGRRPPAGGRRREGDAPSP